MTFTIKANNGERFNIKQMERSRKQLEARLEKLRAEHKKDDVVTFEELGVSAVYNGCSGESAENLENSIPPTKAKLTLTVEEMAQQLNVSRATAYNLARRKDFYPAFRIGERLIISTQALVRWLDEQTEG